MKVSVLIPSRGRTDRLAKAILSLHSRAGGRHVVRYVVGADACDPRTIAKAYALRLQGLPVDLHVAVRQGSLGGLVNRMAEANPADVYCSLGDDIICLTPGWDEVIAYAHGLKPDGVFWWKEARGATYAIVSERWRVAAGRIFTDYFPFWWDDVWLHGVWRYAYGSESLVLGCEIQDQSVETTRMRDLAEWTDFFWSREGERIAEARRIAAMLGWPKVELKPHLAIVSNEDYVRNIPRIEARQGDRGPPTPEYLKALARMRAMRAA